MSLQWWMNPDLQVMDTDGLKQKRKVAILRHSLSHLKKNKKNSADIF